MVSPISAEASQFVKTFDVDKKHNLQATEVTRDFIFQFLNKSAAVQEAIIAKMTTNARQLLSAEILFLAQYDQDMLGGRITEQVVKKAKATVKYRKEPKLKGVRIISGADKRGFPRFCTFHGISYIPLGTKGGESARIFC